eukprot:COSAG02_NODE_1475_length_12422_cov_20.622170_1_plen_465_part_10
MGLWGAGGCSAAGDDSRAGDTSARAAHSAPSKLGAMTQEARRTGLQRRLVPLLHRREQDATELATAVAAEAALMVAEQQLVEQQLAEQQQLERERTRLARERTRLAQERQRHEERRQRYRDRWKQYQEEREEQQEEEGEGSDDSDEGDASQEEEPHQPHVDAGDISERTAHRADDVQYLDRVDPTSEGGSSKRRRVVGHSTGSAAVAAAAAAAVSAGPHKPKPVCTLPGWTVAWSSEHKQWFFWNPQNKVSAWNHPDCPPPTAPSSASRNGWYMRLHAGSNGQLRKGQLFFETTENPGTLLELCRVDGWDQAQDIAFVSRVTSKSGCARPCSQDCRTGIAAVAQLVAVTYALFQRMEEICDVAVPDLVDLLALMGDVPLSQHTTVRCTWETVKRRLQSGPNFGLYRGSRLVHTSQRSSQFKSAPLVLCDSSEPTLHTIYHPYGPVCKLHSKAFALLYGEIKLSVP